MDRVRVLMLLQARLNMPALYLSTAETVDFIPCPSVSECYRAKVKQLGVLLRACRSVCAACVCATVMSFFLLLCRTSIPAW